MPNNTFYLKYRDTRPVLDVLLRDPDRSVHDLTGSTDWKLHIRLDDGTTLTRTMTVQGVPTAGTLRYTWVAADWDTGQLPNPETAIVKLRMEYEVLGPSTARLTFPNDRHDVLQITPDIGQG